jgi:hypothetical protein
MSINPMHKAHAAPRLGSPVVRLLCEVGRSAACTAHAAGRLKASGMAITGTVAERRK